MKKEENTELCLSCIHSTGCVYKKNNQETPVLQCEQFETEQDKNIPGATNQSPGDEVKPTANQDAYKGLCRTCAVREICEHVKPGEGVLNCEEYE